MCSKRGVHGKSSSTHNEGEEEERKDIDDKTLIRYLPDDWKHVVHAGESDKLRDFLRIESDDATKKVVNVVFVCYKSSEILKNLDQTEHQYKFDLGIFDEAHEIGKRSDSSESAKESAKEKRIGLDEASVEIEKRLFMTATATLKRGRDLSQQTQNKNDEGNKVGSLCIVNERDPTTNRRLFGERVHHVNMRDAIDANLICPYKLSVTAPLSRDTVENVRTHTLKGLDLSEAVLKEDKYGTQTLDTSNSEVSAPVSTKDIARLSAFDDLCKKKALKKAFLFSGRILDCRRYRKIAQYLDTKNCFETGTNEEAASKSSSSETTRRYYYSVDSKLSSSDIEDCFALFETFPRAWLSNPKMLGVGIDVPQMEAVAMFMMLKSPVSIAQIMGRPMRIDPNNRAKVAHVMLPFFVDDPDKVDEEDEGDDERGTSSKPSKSKKAATSSTGAETDDDVPNFAAMTQKKRDGLTRELDEWCDKNLMTPQWRRVVGAKEKKEERKLYHYMTFLKESPPKSPPAELHEYVKRFVREENPKSARTAHVPDYDSMSEDDLDKEFEKLNEHYEKLDNDENVVIPSARARRKYKKEGKEANKDAYKQYVFLRYLRRRYNPTTGMVRVGAKKTKPTLLRLEEKVDDKRARSVVLTGGDNTKSLVTFSHFYEAIGPQDPKLTKARDRYVRVFSRSRKDTLGTTDHADVDKEEQEEAERDIGRFLEVRAYNPRHRNDNASSGEGSKDAVRTLCKAVRAVLMDATRDSIRADDMVDLLKRIATMDKKEREWRTSKGKIDVRPAGSAVSSSECEGGASKCPEEEEETSSRTTACGGDGSRVRDGPMILSIGLKAIFYVGPYRCDTEKPPKKGKKNCLGIFLHNVKTHGVRYGRDLQWWQEETAEFVCPSIWEN